MCHIIRIFCNHLSLSSKAALAIAATSLPLCAAGASMIPTLRAPSQLAAIYATEGTTLSWQAPDTAVRQEWVNDSFEWAEPFAIDDAGAWTFVDADGQAEYSFATIPFAGAYEPSAFRVLNSEDLGIGVTWSGLQALGCFSSVGQPTDAWLISPRLSGESHTVSFWAKSHTARFGLETIELYHTTATSPAQLSAFTLSGAAIEVPDQWTAYELAVPAGTTYFALRCTSEERFLLLVDDFRLRVTMGGEAPAAYNVYRNGQRINAVPVTETRYADTDPERAADDLYYVTALYASGESTPCEPCATSSLAPMAADPPAGAPRVYTLCGRAVTAGGELPRGVYIQVGADGCARKLLR